MDIDDPIRIRRIHIRLGRKNNTRLVPGDEGEHL